MIIKEKKIKTFIVLFLEKLKVKKKDAKIIAKYLVDSDMAGHFSHGINRMFQYENAVSKKIISINSKIKIVKKNNFVKVDGNFNFGQIVMQKVCDYLKKNKNVNFVSIVNSAHIGRLSDYVEELSNHGYVSLFFASGGGPNVAPFPIQNRIIGTNPFAFSMPIDNNKNFVTDFSSAAIAEGKINISMREKKKLTEHAIINSFGKDSNNPKDLYSGGAIKPFGGHKGSAFSLVIEFLSGLAISENVSFKKKYRDSNNCFLILFKKKNLLNKFKTKKQINSFYQKIKLGKKIKKYKKKKIYFPGEIEREKYKNSKKYGINYNSKLIKDLLNLGKTKYNLKYNL